jgi:putative hemolysin
MRRAETSLLGEAGRGSSRRWGVRGLAVFTIAVVTVFALATVAGAETVTSKSNTTNLAVACAKRGGKYAESADGTLGTCKFPDGQITTCDNTVTDKDNCTTTWPRKTPESPLKEIQELGLGGRSDGKTSGWTQKVKLPRPDVNGVGVAQDVCSVLGGQFVAFPDGAVGGCRTQNATVVCQNNEPGNNCTGLADTKKHAASTRKKVQASLKTSSTTTPGGSTATTTPTTTTPGGSTTTTGATTTTTGATTKTTTTTTPQRR